MFVVHVGKPESNTRHKAQGKGDKNIGEGKGGMIKPPPPVKNMDI